MTALDDMLKGNLLMGLGLGLGAVLLVPVAGQVLRPAVKELIKGGMLAYQGLAELAEIATDIVAEAQHELAPLVGEAEPARRSSSRRRRQSPSS